MSENYFQDNFNKFWIFFLKYFFDIEPVIVQPASKFRQLKSPTSIE